MRASAHGCFGPEGSVSTHIARSRNGRSKVSAASEAAPSGQYTLEIVARRDVEQLQPPQQQRASDAGQSLLSAEIDDVQTASGLEAAMAASSTRFQFGIIERL